MPRRVVENKVSVARSGHYDIAKTDEGTSQAEKKVAYTL